MDSPVLLRSGYSITRTTAASEGGTSLGHDDHAFETAGQPKGAPRITSSTLAMNFGRFSRVSQYSYTGYTGASTSIEPSTRWGTQGTLRTTALLLVEVETKAGLTKAQGQRAAMRAW